MICRARLHSENSSVLRYFATTAGSSRLTAAVPSPPATLMNELPNHRRFSPLAGIKAIRVPTQRLRVTAATGAHPSPRYHATHESACQSRGVMATRTTSIQESIRRHRYPLTGSLIKCLDQPGRHAGDHRVRRKAACDDRTGPDHTVITQCYTREHRRPEADEDVSANSDRSFRFYRLLHD